jgi:hypothetical protein
MSRNTFRRRATAAAIAIAAGASMSTLTAPGANAALYYGAIAMAPNGAGGSTWGYPSRADAEGDALATCGYTSCKVLSSFTECGAVAANSTRYQGGVGPTLALAQLDALTKLKGGAGYIEYWACN